MQQVRRTQQDGGLLATECITETATWLSDAQRARSREYEKQAVDDGEWVSG